MSDVQKRPGVKLKSTEKENYSTTVSDLLAVKVPSEVEVNVPASSESSPEMLIEKANSQIENNILSIIRKNEETRLNRQKPVLRAVLIFVGLQMFAFNVLIGGLVTYCALHPEDGIFQLISDFLKYYTGAVLVEMIGMIVFITKSTFTSSTKELIQGISMIIKGNKNI